MQVFNILPVTASLSGYSLPKVYTHLFEFGFQVRKMDSRKLSPCNRACLCIHCRRAGWSPRCVLIFCLIGSKRIIAREWRHLRHSVPGTSFCNDGLVVSAAPFLFGKVFLSPDPAGQDLTATPQKDTQL